MADPLRVLILPGATEIGLEVRRALGFQREIELHSGGQRGSSHSPYVYERHWELPSVHDASFTESLGALVASTGIDLVYPAHDDVLVAMTAPEVTVPWVGSPASTVALCRSKSATYSHLDGIVDLPARFDPDAVDRFPVFVKPDRGQGSAGARRIDDADALRAARADDPSLIVMEHLPGEEFTVDCFCGPDGTLRFLSGRRRVRVRSGIAMDTLTVDDPRFADIARALSGSIEFRGAWFFQVKEDRHGTLRLLEAAPRIAGTSALQRVRGVNLPLLSVYAALGVDTEILAMPVTARLDRALVNRYHGAPPYDTVYIDLDDTLLLRGVVQDSAIRLVFQAINQGKAVHLVTRHASDLDRTLRSHRLSGIFDEVHHLRADEPKSSVVRGRSIFIDDSYAERREVHRSTGVPTFDLSMIELLLDERI